MAAILVALTLGPMLAAVAALAAWLTLGSSALMWRSAIVIVGASSLGLVFCATSGELEAEWLGLTWMVTVTIALMFVTIRQQGLRLVDTRKPIQVNAEEFQFSVLHLIGMTAAVALAATFVRKLAPLAVTLNALLVGFGIAICLGSLAIVVLWTTLRRRRPTYGTAIFAITTMAVSGAVYIAMEATNADPGIVWGSVVVVYALSLRALSQFLFRRGFALVSISEYTAVEQCRPTVSPR